MDYNVILVSEFLSEEFRGERQEYAKLDSKEKILFWEKSSRKGELERLVISRQEKHNNTFRNAVNDID